MIKHVLDLTITMIGDMYSQLFEALLVPEQIDNIERRVGMCFPEGEGPDPDLSPSAGRYGDR